MTTVLQVPTFSEAMNPEFVSSLSPFYQARLKAIADHDFEKMKFKFREELASKGLPHDDNYLNRGILALQQYYAVAALDPHNMHAVSAEVDPFWHIHMLFSKDYTALSTAIFGQYMHHDPLDHADQPKVEFVHKLYNYTLEVYGTMFSYYDPEMYPAIVAKENLICVHFGTTLICFHATDEVVNDPTELFPVNAELAPYYAQYN